MPNSSHRLLAAVAAGILFVPVLAAQQQAPAAAPAPDAPQAAKPQGFPPVNPAYFDAAHPSKDVVDAFLQAQFGFDSNRTWQVQAIRKTIADGYSDVLILLSTRTSPDQVSQLNMVVTPDDKYAIIGGSILRFGADPFTDMRARLRKDADGPSVGPKDAALQFTEFSDLQCPHCKVAEPTMEKLRHDYPNARFVYQNYPLAMHDWAAQAAAWDVCVAQQGSGEFFKFISAVFEGQDQTTQQNLTAMMRSAAAKAGADAAKAEACVAKPETAATVKKQVELAQAIGVDSTPTLFVNGRALAVSENLSYELLQQIIAFQSKLDGIKQ